MASMTQLHPTFLQNNNLFSRLVTEHKKVAGSYYFSGCSIRFPLRMLELHLRFMYYGMQWHLTGFHISVESSKLNTLSNL